ncbi:hypothetical protein Belba_2076 [Belliella baltica DSM 15883]|uniref:Uncharacterized protein n=1 Tax=Belliella baltica (strain DSM 15883 / CIP 108006 / LMG 21964 / BA134) TaxID=866536 RepID=I3Z5X6_BELBD|nr:hypothetical protein [Belliella baltica]AFL84644.1 hypothetical protein Belba_2076 [Belliella baltica DSM 15883]
MNKVIYVVLFIFVYASSCSPSPEKQAKEIIASSISYHDPKSNWGNLERIVVEKQQINYDSEGLETSEIIFSQEFRLKPYFEAKHTWEKDSITHKVTFDGLNVNYMMGENEVLNPGFLKSNKAELELAYLDLVMPMTLSSMSKSLLYQNKINLSDNRVAETVAVELKDGKNLDLYFLPETYQLIAYKQKIRDEFEVVNNVEMQDYKGMSFPAKKEVFASDSLGNHLYLKSIITYQLTN